jgi:hypothetical protein
MNTELKECTFAPNINKSQTKVAIGKNRSRVRVSELGEVGGFHSFNTP